MTRKGVAAKVLPVVDQSRGLREQKVEQVHLRKPSCIDRIAACFLTIS